MILSRSSALRASSIARLARPTRNIRTAELQPWQRMLQQTGRRTYASEHGAHTATKKSDLPWLATAVAVTGLGGFVIFTQDLSHGEGHEGHDDHHAEKHEEHDEAEAPAEPKEEKEDKEEGEKDASSKQDKSEETKAEKKEDKKEDKKEEKKEAPSKSDEPSAIKPSKSQNEQSGKQQGLDNDDTGHTSAPQDDPQKSKKGEGAAETAKLKGTVSTERPPAENKEERGKTSVDKSK
ncbi:hypothetical protein B0J11DRAFT_515255 [Dendryphion nanum]|uniref:Uncharacterized protein n=1 Tax=Dendryphion nanum TaxID=256645 RepID=A0A9P9EJT3_9PLEO|nr:hypothetical protein B0J11DRAFT_515255 [Dendryphion nanum]